MQQKLNKPKAMLFDMDNTLIDTWPVMHEAIKSTMIAMGVEPWSFEKSKVNMHASLREYFPKLFGEAWPKASKLYYEHYVSNSSKLAKLPDVELVLDLLKEKQVYTAIVSNKRGPILREEITNYFKWDHYFHKIIGATDAEEDKPSSMPAELSLNGTNIVLDENVWFIGDTLTDMQCAYNSNCTAVLFGDLSPTSPILKDCKPHLYFKTHQDLHQHLQSIL